MRILRLEADNFASYRRICLDVDNLGLTLVSGPTGAGKSTLVDLIPWCLFGVTAKNGNADDVRSWFTSQPTTVKLDLEASNGRIITVARIRGRSRDNDLYWVVRSSSGDEKLHRGKDLLDSQRLLSEFLGVTGLQFRLSSYYSESCESASFFSVSARARRDLLENIADTSVATRLSRSASDRKKVVGQQKENLTKELAELKGSIHTGQHLLARAEAAKANWAEKTAKEIQELSRKSQSFEADKDKNLSKYYLLSEQWMDSRREAINDVNFRLYDLENSLQPTGAVGSCPTCGAEFSPDSDDAKELDRLAEAERQTKINALRKEIKLLEDSHNPHQHILDRIKAEENLYDEQIRKLERTENPYMSQIETVRRNLEADTASEKEKKLLYGKLAEEVSALETIYDVSIALRGELTRQAIKNIESDTNGYLSRYFDAEIRVEFSLDGDQINVGIWKNGYSCSFWQLSKGQRALLKLTFGISVMQAVSNNIGVHSNYLAFDEALDGLDAELKVKAFRLFEDLNQSHSSVLVVDHATELQQMFPNKLLVRLEGDESVVESA